MGFLVSARLSLSPPPPPPQTVLNAANEEVCARCFSVSREWAAPHRGIRGKENLRTCDGGCHVCVWGPFFLVTPPVPAPPVLLLSYCPGMTQSLPISAATNPPAPHLGTASSLGMADLVATQPRKFCLWPGAPVAEPG